MRSCEQYQILHQNRITAQMHTASLIFHHLTQLYFAAGAGDIINTSAGNACAGVCGQSSIQVLFKNITKILLYLIGSISIIMIIIGGLRFVLANGDSKQAGEARNTILYAVIGIVVAISALAIVTFVTSNIK
jgi:hypothetical protein